MRHTILYINAPPYLGGAELSLLDLMRHLDPKRYAPCLLTSAEGPLVERARGMGLDVMMLDFPWFSRRKPWQYGLCIYRLVKTIRARKISLIHVSCDRGIAFAVQASRFTGIPYVVYVQDVVRDWFAPAPLRAMQGSRGIITNSRWVAQVCQDNGIAAEHLTIVYPPVDLAAYDVVSMAAISALRQEFNILKNQIVIGLVGQIHPLKGQLEFVQAAIQVARIVPNAVFLIVGAAMSPELADFEQSLHMLLKRSGLAARFRFTGFRKDIPDLMHLCDILVMSSHNEAFGRVVVEGMAAGCAVVGTDSGGIPEIIEHDVDGLLVPSKDVAALAAGILRLCADDGLRAALGRAAPEKAKRFSIERHVAQMQTLYDSCV